VARMCVRGAQRVLPLPSTLYMMVSKHAFICRTFRRHVIRASLPPQACHTVFTGSAQPVPVRVFVFTEHCRLARALFRFWASTACTFTLCVSRRHVGAEPSPGCSLLFAVDAQALRAQLSANPFPPRAYPRALLLRHATPAGGTHR